MTMKVDFLKNSAQQLVIVLCVAASPIVAGMVVTGCAGDRYHESTGESIDDTATTARVKSALSGDPQFKYGDVHVATFKGTVQLSGFVNTSDAKSHAGDLAKNVEGAKSVQNEISVKE
jgi:hyperosmotically inducible periplasmic protein